MLINQTTIQYSARMIQFDDNIVSIIVTYLHDQILSFLTN